MKPQYAAIGIPCESGKFALSAEAARIVSESRVFSGGKRHFEKVRPLLPPNAEWIEIGGDIEKILDIYESRIESGSGTVVIFASGNPLFYGIGSTLKRLKPNRALKVFPAPSSVQTLCRKARMPCGNIAGASVHGRDWHELDAALIAGEKLTGLLTDSVNSPAEAARRMIEYGFEGYRCVAGERLGETDEKIRFLTVREMARESFAQPCAVILEKAENVKNSADEADFETLKHKPGMITKPSVRKRTVRRLNLGGAEHFWDIGFCTGSVSIEARRNFPRLRVTAFEKNPQCRKLMEKNAKKFSAPGIKTVMRDFFDCAPEKLPAPDSVFIGGHGGRLEDMMKTLVETVRPGGTLVINSVSEKSPEIFRRCAKDAGFRFQKPEAAGNITILSAVKK